MWLGWSTELRNVTESRRIAGKCQGAARSLVESLIPSHWRGLIQCDELSGEVAHTVIIKHDA